MKKIIKIIFAIAVWSFIAWVYFDINKNTAYVDTSSAPLSNAVLQKVINSSDTKVKITADHWELEDLCVAPSTCLTNTASNFEALGKWVTKRTDIGAPEKGFTANTYLKVVDKYGNESRSLAYTLHFAKQDILRVNWAKINLLMVLNLARFNNLNDSYKTTVYKYCFEDNFAGKRASVMPEFCSQIDK